MGNRVRERRERVGWTQEQLADDLGVTRQTIISIEGGRYAPSLGLAIKIARRFNAFVEEIFSDEHGNYVSLTFALPPGDRVQADAMSSSAPPENF